MQAQVLLVAISTGVGVIVRMIHHMAQPVPHNRLRNANAHVGSNAPVDQAEIFFAVPVQRETSNKDKATAILNVIKELGEIVSDFGNGEMLSFDIVQRQPLAVNGLKCCIESCVMFGSEIECIVVWRGKISCLPSTWVIDMSAADFHHRALILSPFLIG